MLAALVPVSCLLLGAALGETRIGVLPIQISGDLALAPSLSSALTTALVAEIRRSAPAREVFGPEDVAALVGAANPGACADSDCFAAVAAGAGVEQLVLANLVRLGRSDLLMLMLLDARRKLVLASVEDRNAATLGASTGHEGGAEVSPDVLDRLASAVAQLLASSQPQWLSEAASFGRLEVLLDPWPAEAGRIDVRVAQPGGLALLDDRPLQIGVATDVPAGMHRLRVMSMDFKRAQELMVEIKPAAVKTVKVDLGRGSTGIGRLEVNAEPGTRIDLDGQTLGVAPMAPVAIPEGPHEIRLVHGARGATVQFAVTAHATVRVAPPLVSDAQ